MDLSFIWWLSLWHFIYIYIYIYARVSSNNDFYRGFIANIEPRRVLAGKLAG